MDMSELPANSTIISRIDLRPLLLKSMYPAPPAMELFSVDADNSTSAKEIRDKLSFEQLWQAGNRFLKENHYDLADEYYSHAIKKNADSSRIHALKGLVLLCKGDLTPAGKILSKALLKDGDIIQARIWLGYIRLKENKPRGVSHQLSILEKRSDLKKEDRIMLLILKSLLLLVKNKDDEAEVFLRKSLEAGDESVSGYLLSYIGFKKGSHLFFNGDLDSAIKEWISYSRICRNSWYGVPEIKTFFSNLANHAVFKNKYQELKNKLKTQSKPELHYKYVSFTLLKLQLLPEFYEEFGEIESRQEYWGNKLQGSNTYPYAHFRYAITLLYQNKLKESYEELLHFREEVPASKQSYFKIEYLLGWLRKEIDFREGRENTLLQ